MENKRKTKKYKCRANAPGCQVEYYKATGRLAPVCYNHECMIAWSVKQSEKKAVKQLRKEARELKLRKEALMSRTDWLNKARDVFNRFIRLRDKNMPCISCGRHHSGQYHAGHFMTVGARPDLRFCESNVHKQCAPCNNHLSGNIPLYRQSLITILGSKAVDDLESGRRGNSNWSITDIKEIIGFYKHEIRRFEHD